MPQLLAIHLSLPKNSLRFFLPKNQLTFWPRKPTGFTWFHPPKKGHRFSFNGKLSPEVLAKGEQRHLLDGDRLVLNLGQAWDPQDGMDGMGWEKTLAPKVFFLFELEEVRGSLSYSLVNEQELWHGRLVPIFKREYIFR